ncbi:MAG: glycosyltransferase family 2 protein [Oscillospiraceae bacterium]|nr:glycosyltransferase family 2 protein [Oscillospiraceae bacterium]
MISVIIPAYNRENSIKAAVESVLNQTYSDLELIVVDDCSTDSTREAVEQIKDKRLRYICLEKNSGACAARNRGVSAARGEYIAFQDSDDIWMDNKLEKQMKVFEETDCDIVSCAMLAYSGDTSWVVPEESRRTQGYKSLDDILKKSFISTQTIIAKRKCFDDTLFDVLMPRMQDWDWVIRAVQKYSLYFIDEPLVKQYRQENSITANPHKGVVAMKRISEKYSYLLSTNKKTLGIFYDDYAYFLALDNNFSEFRKAAGKSLKASFGLKKLVKYILVNFRLYKQPQ